MSTNTESKPRPPISSNLEDYLEVIFHLQEKNRVARAKDIADGLGVTRASVTSALKALSENDLINYQPYSYITLTEKGEAVAREIVRRHENLKDFFLNFLMLESGPADENACRMEHAIDTQAMDRLVCFLEFMRQCPRCGPDWSEAFSRFVHNGTCGKDCRICIDRCRKKL